MKGKDITIQQLQENIDRRLAQFEGSGYKGTNFHGMYAREITREFHGHGVQELTPCIWGIRASITQEEIRFLDRIAEVNIGFKRDKRFKNSAGRGVILGMRVAFREELLPLTLDQARTFLLVQKRDDDVRERRAEIDACTSTIRTNEEAIARLLAIAL